MSQNQSFLQANLNHCAAAQDLLLQSMAQWKIDLAVACEPYYIPSRGNWMGDLDGSVAILTGPGVAPPLLMLESGSGYVAAEWGEYIVVGTYFSPNRGLTEFETFLDTVRTVIERQVSRPIILLGDLNAKSRAWGNPADNARGRALQIWAVLSGMSLLNRGSTHTCVRHQGGSVVDVSFATPAVARKVENWRVEEDVETMSDHMYIRFEISSTPGTLASSTATSRFPRWALTRLDREVAKEAAMVQGWVLPVGGQSHNVDEMASRMRTALTEVCDSAMPRIRRRLHRRQVYWWNDEIANLRTACNTARRVYVRCRRRFGHDPAMEHTLHENYRQAKKSLQLAIKKAKTQAREELLSGLNRDPWGRPYRAARKKLRNHGAPITTTMEPALLERVVSMLFPNPPAHAPPAMVPPVPEAEQSVEAPTVTEGEMNAALFRLRGKKTAPGPDGVPGRVICLAAEYLGDGIRELFDVCLRCGQFPKLWKEGRLCLLQKEGRPADSPSAYRPVVLLDETAKLFEKILADRLVRHLEDIGPGLSDAQYGFRAGRSTIDALDALKSLTTNAVERGQVVMAISLDVRNAFNSLPFETLKEAFRFHKVPAYLGRLLEAYLEDRVVLWEGKDGELHQRRVGCGVPQGSVLGPILWNIGFDWLLRGTLLPGARVICYADDTLVTARGRSYEEAARLSTVVTSLVIDRIHMLGLSVAIDKTEALLFHGPRRGPPRGANISLFGTDIPVKAQMRYLGLILDGRWSFRAHFVQLAPKLVGAAAALGRLLPNVGGPNSLCRRLYSGIIRSMALYGAPIWVNALTAQNKALLRRPQRAIAVRAIRGYRTVSWTAATLLAADPPWELQAEILADVHRGRADSRAMGEDYAGESAESIRATGQTALLRKWAEDLESPVAGVITVEAVRPHLMRWVARRHGTLSYRMTQVLTGHGCFGDYLHRVARREELPVCHECGAQQDTTLHTLLECTAWSSQRRTLKDIVGGDLSLSSIISAMLDSDRGWEAMASFCDDVISQKEAAERVREDDPLANPLRRRRLGRRRRLYAHLLPPP